MTTVRLLFLGASRLVELLTRFHAAAEREGVTAEIISIEDANPWHAIAAAGVARVVPGPRFDDPAFDDFFYGVIKQFGIQAVIPSVDPAVRALALRREALQKAGVDAVVSAPELCAQVADKMQAQALFEALGVPVPRVTGYPRLVKPRRGSSGRGQVVLQDADEESAWAAHHQRSEFIIQPLLPGVEYSVDCFVTHEGQCLGAIPRRRIVVSGGEVMVARTERHAKIEELSAKLLALPGWYGPLNIQFMDTPDQGPLILEINARTGSGITCAVEAGLDFPGWIVRRTLHRSVPAAAVQWKEGLTMTRSRKDHFLW